MTTLIDNGNLTLHVHIRPLDVPASTYWLSFATQLATAKSPGEEHTAFSVLLNREQLGSLKEAIQTALESP